MIELKHVCSVSHSKLKPAWCMAVLLGVWLILARPALATDFRLEQGISLLLKDHMQSSSLVAPLKLPEAYRFSSLMLTTSGYGLKAGVVERRQAYVLRFYANRGSGPGDSIELNVDSDWKRAIKALPDDGFKGSCTERETSIPVTSASFIRAPLWLCARQDIDSRGSVTMYYVSLRCAVGGISGSAYVRNVRDVIEFARSIGETG
ncbi:MAG: hypothetical protein ACAI44_21745 [Candidatus Sericytochromatia bacterium]